METVFRSWVEPIADLIGFGKARGWVTVDEFDAALDSPAATRDLVEDLFAALNRLGIVVLERLGGAPAAEAAPDPGAAAIRRLVRRGLARGYVTRAELLAALPPGDASDTARENHVRALRRFGIPVRESDRES